MSPILLVSYYLVKGYLPLSSSLRKRAFKSSTSSDLRDLKEYFKALHKSRKYRGNVSKTQEFVKFMTDYDIIIQVNEPIFDQLEDKQKEYVVKDLLARVFYDVDKDKVSILPHDITTFSGVLNSYDIETYLSIKESIVTLLEQKQIQEDAKK